ncbi:MAG: protoheme IX farnesyltransferase [Proteobacteria bacterium]|nr:protoheme IX farnesyltransferase [Pseudomonadota bacterium]
MKTDNVTNESTNAAAKKRSRNLPRMLREFFQLTKPGVVALIVFTAVVGMYLSTPGAVPFDILILGTLGIGLAAGSAAAINHVLDQKADAIMARTRHRPLPKGELTSTEAIVFAIILGAIAMAILAIWINALTAWLTFFSLIGYSVIYTVFLKRETPQNIVIGGAAGAAPPVLGWTAVTGEVTGDALLLFLIIFLWTPPHFWALALYRVKEYERANIPMLPVTHGSKFTRLQILLYTILLVVITTVPFFTGMAGSLYLLGVSILNIIFLYSVIALYINYSDLLSRKTFKYSIHYLSLVFMLLLIDHYRLYIMEALQSVL